MAEAAAPAPSGGGAVGILRKGGSGRPREVDRDKLEGESGPDNMRSGTRVISVYRDGSERKAVVLERRPVRGADEKETGLFRYYVHWLDFNRRMDSWVTHDRIRYDAEGEGEEKRKRDAKSSAAAALAATAAGGSGTGAGAGAGAGPLGSGAAAAASSNSGGKGSMGAGDGSAEGGSGLGKGASSSSASTSVASARSEGGSGAGAGAGPGTGAVSGVGTGTSAAAAAAAAAGEDEREEVDESGTVFRGRKRKADGTIEISFVEPEHSADGMNADAIHEHEEVTKMKNVNEIELGRYRMETWYFSPIPKEYWPEDFIDVLFFCEFCLRFFRSKPELLHHCSKCRLRHPPGDEIYRGADGTGVWEIDGAKEKQYCQNLCYLAKMFLDHKTLYHDVDLFVFYVMTEVDAHGYHIVGYYSKEKYSEVGYNLACILALPCHQRKGFGRFIIQFSYELSKIEKKVGHPEKPLSDLGLLSYRSYWTWVLLGILREMPEGEEISIMDVMRRTSIRSEDVTSTMQNLGLLRYVQGGGVTIVYNKDFVESEFLRQDAKPGPRVDPARILWSPLKNPLPAHVKKDKFAFAAKEMGE